MANNGADNKSRPELLKGSLNPAEMLKQTITPEKGTNSNTQGGNAPQSNPSSDNE